MKGRTTANESYLELIALLIDREIAKFRRGEQAALVSFAHVAKLARNATEELAASDARARARPSADLHRRSSKRRGRGRSAAHGQAPEF